MAFTHDQFRLDGKVAIVTGAGGRGNSIGRAYSFGLAQAGAIVVVADLNEAGAQAVAAEITEAGGQAIGVKVDVADEASTLAMAAAATEAFGGIDILVNNAALMVDISYDNCETISLANWNRAFSVNLNGALLCSRAVIPSMRARGGGRIVNQTSGGAFPAIGLYGISKLALVGLTTTLAKQFRQGQDHLQRHRPRQCHFRCGQSAGPRRFALHQIPGNDLRHPPARRPRRAGRHAATCCARRPARGSPARRSTSMAAGSCDPDCTIVVKKAQCCIICGDARRC